MSYKYTGDDLPANFSEWKNATCQYKTISLHELDTPKSASKISVEQFLSLKVLWTHRQKPTALYEDKVLTLFNSSKEDISKERDLMRKDPAWGAYLRDIAVSQGAGVPRTKLKATSQFSKDLGAYALVLQPQLEVSGTDDSLNDSGKLLLTPLKPRYNMRPRPEPEDQDPKGKNRALESPSGGSPHSSQGTKSSSAPEDISPMGREAGLSLPTGDEQIVNIAAINFLNALSVYEERYASWSTTRKEFKFHSNSAKFEARTDGHLKVHGNNSSAAILEVKPRRRYYEKGFRIEMQESMQMALWIFQEPNSHWAAPSGGEKYYRLLLSQDRDEIYVTLAEYTEKYVLYLQNKLEFKDEGFLRMNIYGPFAITNSRLMSWLGPVLRVLLRFAATNRPSQQLPPSRLRTPSPPTAGPADERMEKTPEKQKERVRRRSRTRSPLADKGPAYAHSQSSSTTSESDAPIRKPFENLRLGEKKRSTSQSPQRGRPRSGREPPV